MQRDTVRTLATLSMIAALAPFGCAMDAPDQDSTTREVVYGADGRTDPFAHADADLRRMARSVAVLSWKSNVSTNAGSGAVTLTTRTLDQRITTSQGQGLCPGERFANEPTHGWCTGFMVSPTRMVTAGHCLDRNRDRQVTQQEASSFCDDVAVVFEHERVQGAGGQVQAAPVDHDDTFFCRRVVGYDLQCGSETGCRGGIDYAVFDLDRDTERPGLPLDPNARANLQNGTAVAVIGHPNGLPKKIDSTGAVRAARTNQVDFVANVDTFGGNSGSPIIDTATERVIGILVRGERDYDRVWNATLNAYCTEVNTEQNNAGRGEDATHIAALGRWADTAEPNEIAASDYPVVLAPAASTGGTHDVLRFQAGGDRGGFHRIAANDSDWFAIPVYGGDQVTVTAEFTHADGDLDMSITGDTGTLATSHSTTDDESATFTVPGTGASGVYVKLYGYQGATNDYQLRIDVAPSTGTMTCSPSVACAFATVCNPRPGFIGVLRDGDELDLTRASGVCEAVFDCVPYPGGCTLQPATHDIYIDVETTHPYANGALEDWAIGLPGHISTVSWLVDHMQTEPTHDRLLPTNGTPVSGTHSNITVSDQTQSTLLGRVYRNGLYLQFESDATITGDGVWIDGLRW